MDLSSTLKILALLFFINVNVYAIDTNEEKKLNRIRDLYTTKKHSELIAHIKANKLTDNEETYLIELMTSPYCNGFQKGALPKEAEELFATVKLENIKRNLYSISCHKDYVLLSQKKGLDLSTSENGFSPFVYTAIRHSNVDLFKYLLSQKVPLKDKLDKTPKGPPNVRTDMRALTSPTNLLTAAVAEGNLEILRMLLDAREFSTTELSEGLMAALGFEQIATAELLLTKSVSVNFQDAQKFTPLHIAAGNLNNPAMTKKLLDMGADPHLKNHSDLDVFEWVDLSANGEGGAGQDFSKVQALLKPHKKKGK